jgi:Flp pilus assembly pilin Flp
MAGLVVSMVSHVARAKACLQSENGANATTYSLLVAFVASAVIGGASLFNALVC